MARPLRLLLIEDSENDARLLLRILRQGGYDPSFLRVDTAPRLNAALSERDWDLIIADYNMPRFSGMTALGLVRQRGLDTPFILMSGQIGEDLAVAAMKAGAQDYIMKDNPVRLLPAIERELKEAEERRERREVQTALGETQERYKTLVELSPEPIVVHSEGKIVYANAAAVRLAGLEQADELLGLPLMNFVPPESQQVIDSRVRQVYEEGRGAPLLEVTLVRRDGQLIEAEIASIPIQHEGKPAAQVVIRDMSERRRVERRRGVQYAVAQVLAECEDVEIASGRVLEAIGQGLGWALGGFWRVDPDDRALVCGPMWHAAGVDLESFGAACRRARVGVGRGLIGRAWQNAEPLWVQDIAADAAYRQFSSGLAEGLRGGLAVPVVIGQYVLAVMDFFSYDVRPPDEDLIRLMATLGHQIGQYLERKRGETSLLETNSRLTQALDELKRTQQQIVQQERLRALGEMASGVAHDLNNALQPVVGFSELLLAQHEFLPCEDVREYLQMIYTGAADAASVVRGLRDLYRQPRSDEPLSSVSLPDLIQQTVALTRPKWKDEPLARGAVIAIRRDLAEIPAVAAREGALREMLTNLIFNAVDAMPSGGTIDLRTRQEGDFVVIEVEDSGHGMTPEVQARCLEPFFTTKGELGSGLGLPMVSGIVQQHGGTMTLDSEPRRGTRFTIRLPVAPSDVEVETPPFHQERRRLRVLVVDDDPRVRALLEAYLRADGHSVQTADAGPEGFERCRLEEFDLVLTDRAMPEMNGDELAAAVKQLRPGTPVIMLTGFGDIMNGSADRPRSVDCVIGKPVTAEGLRDAMERVLA